MREDIQKSIKEYEIATSPFFKKNAEAAEKFLYDDEKVILCLEANFCINYPDPTKKIALPGIVLLTNNRIIIRYNEYKKECVDTLAMEEINDIKVFSEPLGGDYIQVYSAEKIYSFPIITKQKGLVISLTQSKRAALGKIYNAFLFAKNPNGFEEPKKATTQTAANQSPDIPEQIKKLAELKEKGILTEDEFQAKKSELLARL